ncbi:MAG: PD-(D/E)XK nuclease family protein [Coriobacteriaceae bacterium]|nr:PD-(D/E)XK nuclease family protein [Coriobacteriaceae bacterium]
MGGSAYITSAGSELLQSEVQVVRSFIQKHGRVAVLVPSYAEGELCRRGLADAGVGMFADVLTPAAWIEGLWRLLGDGTRLVSSVDRLLLCSRALDVEHDGADSEGAALADNPGTVRMLANAARTFMPAALRTGAADGEDISASERCVLEALARYGSLLGAQGLCEPSAAADALADRLAEAAPPCANGVVLRGVSDFPEYLVRLLEAIAERGDVAVLLNERQALLLDDLTARLGWPCVDMKGEGPAVPALSFGEVCGPSARAASYTKIALDLLDNSPSREGADEAKLAGEAARDAEGGCVEKSYALAIGAPEPFDVFAAVAPRLAGRGVFARAEGFVAFERTRAGEEFFTLIDFLNRLNTQETSAWWPAPEVADWLRSPFSGAGASPHVALSLDTYMRKTRAMDKERLFAELDSRQSREMNRERDAALQQEREHRPVVFKSVIDALDAKAYARALTLMLEAGSAGASALFGAGGLAVQQVELAALQRAVELLERAGELGVSPERALVALRALKVRASVASCAGRAAPTVLITGVDALSAAAAGTYASVLLVDASANAYPLAERETPESVLAAKLGYAGIRLAPAARQRDQFDRALQAAGRSAALAYVTHDNGSEELYPALAYAELREAACADDAGALLEGLPGEGELFSNLDPALGAGAELDDAPRRSEHVLPEELRGYVLLPKRCINGRPVTRSLSASQIENYLACPYRWFVNSRVVTRRLDVEFGPIERGNFAHDVMQRFYERLAECGLVRVRPQTIDACMEQMDIAFDEVRQDHLRGKYTHGKYATQERPRPIRGALVPLDELERKRMDAMREQFHEVVRHEADLLPIYEPARFEYSFDKQGVRYAGRPLGGRIDRIDVAPDAGSGERFVVIDYKTGANVDAMACPDPTMGFELGEELSPDWLPGRDKDKAPKVQTLMYATALERATGGSAQGAVYYGLRGPSIAGAVSSALTECEPSAFPADKKAYPYPGVKGRLRVKRDGEMEFSELLDRVEQGVARELDALEAGAIAPCPASDSCAYCPLTMCEMRR